VGRRNGRGGQQPQAATSHETSGIKLNSKKSSNPLEDVMRSSRRYVFVGIAMICLAMAPAAFATEYSVNPSQSNSTIQSLITGLLPGDTLDFTAGTYFDSFRLNSQGTAANPITIRGIGNAILDGNNGAVNTSGSGGPRALLEISKNYVNVQNLTLQNAMNNAGNGAGIRITGAGYSTISGCSILHNNMGIMSDDVGTAGAIVDNVMVTGNNIGFNGSATFSGFSHNFYMGGTGSIAIVGNYIHDSLDGQNVKTRAHYVTLAYNWISNSNEGEVGMVDGYTSAANSNALIVGNTIVSSPDRTGNHGKFVLYGSESGTSHIGTAYIYNNTMIAGMTSNVFVQINPNSAGDATNAVLKNNIFNGSTNLATDQTTGGTLVTGHLSGSNNLIPVGSSFPSGSSVTGSVVANNPNFANPTANDFRLLVGSAAINAGTSDLTYVDVNGNTQTLSVLNSYLFGQGEVARAMSGSAMDIGAYEFQQTPEPATMSLLALGGLGLIGAIRRRRAAAA
jgi:hypothetical protein